MPRRPAASSETGEAVANGSTGTNIQEAGVDEPDVAKTNGRIVVRLVEDRRLVITDVTGESARELSDLALPSDAYATGLLLVGDHVLLAGDRGGVEPMLEQERGDLTIAPILSGTELYDVDVSDPANPRLDSRTSWSGRQLSLRQYDDTVRLVTSTGLPQLPFVQPGGRGQRGRGRAAQPRDRPGVDRAGLGTRPRLQRRLPPAEVVRLGDGVRRHVPSRRGR